MMNLCMPLLKNESAFEISPSPFYNFLRIENTYSNYFTVCVFDFIHNIYRFNNSIDVADYTLYAENGDIMAAASIPGCNACSSLRCTQPAESIVLFDLPPLVDVDNVVIPVKNPNEWQYTGGANWDFYLKHLRFGIENNGQRDWSMSFMTSCILGNPNPTKKVLVDTLNSALQYMAGHWGNLLFKNVNDYAFFTEENTIEPNHFSGAVIMANLTGETDRFFRFYKENEKYENPSRYEWCSSIFISVSPSDRLIFYNNYSPYMLLIGSNNRTQDDLVLLLSLLKKDCLNDALRKLNTQFFYQ